MKLENILLDRDPYRGGKCVREECMIYAFNPWEKEDRECTKPNALYDALFIDCLERAEEVKGDNM